MKPGRLAATIGVGRLRRCAVKRIWRCIVVGRPDAEYQAETDEGAERPPQREIDGVMYAATEFVKGTCRPLFGAPEGAQTGTALMFPVRGRYTAEDEAIARKTMGD